VLRVSSFQNRNRFAAFRFCVENPAMPGSRLRGAEEAKQEYPGTSALLT
jgi:hypothetical protein